MMDLRKKELFWIGIIMPTGFAMIFETLWYTLLRHLEWVSPLVEHMIRVLVISSGIFLFTLFFFYNMNKMNLQVKKEQERFQSIIKAVKDGILIMDENRKIHYMNEAAAELTGWKVGETVPYCSYCKNRAVLMGEERCLLQQPRLLDYFEADMPVYEGKKQRTFEMSTAYIDQDEDERRQLILVLRDKEMIQHEEKAKLAQLLIQETLSAQEAERKRIAQELHDGLGQSLYSIYIGLKGIEAQQRGNGKEHAHFSVLEKTVQQAMKEVKTLSYELRPGTLDMLGLSPSLQTLIQFLNEQTEAEIQLLDEIEEERRFPLQMELHLYRIVQEALHNAIKYAGASKITVKLKEEPDGLRIHVIDNGTGFHPDEVKRGLGLKHMKERAQLIGGYLKVNSTPGTGTRISCYVPLKGDETK